MCDLVIIDTGPLLAVSDALPLLDRVSGTLLVARPMDPHGKPEGSYLVAVDTVDAGVGETVLIVSGSSARMAAGMKDCPIDAAIVGIVDTVDVAAGD